MRLKWKFTSPEPEYIIQQCTPFVPLISMKMSRYIKLYFTAIFICEWCKSHKEVEERDITINLELL